MLSTVNRLRVGLIGAGAIGRHHARILGSLGNIHFAGIHDSDEKAATLLCENHGGKYYSSLTDLFDCLDVLYIATPTSTHHGIAIQAIERRLHTFIEKPIAATVLEANEIVKAAESSGCKVAVGHVERFNPVVRWLAAAIAESQILSINISRVGPRPPRVKDVGIVIDLAVHDLDLIYHLSKSTIEDISAFVTSTFGKHEDVAQIIVKTTSGVIGAINTNWLTPYKSRVIQIATPGMLYVGDLVAGTIAKYEGIGDSGNKYVVENVVAASAEPLVLQSKEFLNSIINNTASANASAVEGARTVELATRCLIQSQGGGEK